MTATAGATRCHAAGTRSQGADALPATRGTTGLSQGELRVGLLRVGLLRMGLLRMGLLTMGLLCAGVAAAQPDPTRPPMTKAQAAALVRSASGPAAARPAGPPGPGAAAAAAAASSPAPTQVPLPRPRVQSVQLLRQGASSALVDGRLVRVGDALADGTVVAIDVEGLLLRSAGVQTRLRLLDYPLPPSPVGTRRPPAEPDDGPSAASPAKAPVAALTGTKP